MSDFNHIWLDRPYNELTDEQLKAVADWHQGWDDKQSHRACVYMMALRTERDAERERVARLVELLSMAAEYTRHTDYDWDIGFARDVAAELEGK